MKYSGLFLSALLLLGACASYCTGGGAKKEIKGNFHGVERLRVSRTNSHLLETISGKPVFLNNFTAWDIIGKLTREDVVELMSLCKIRRFNMISAVILEEQTSTINTTIYNAHGFENDTFGNPDPLKPIVTPGNDPGIPGQYDFWDHVDYVVNMAAANGMYISLHPTWGDWVSGSYRGKLPGDKVIFNETKAYKYGQWLGHRYGEKQNIIWMLGGDRSAIYDCKTLRTSLDSIQDFRAIYRAMAEGLVDGTNGENNQDGLADYSKTIISFHPRKWAPNSSEWFHNDRWLTFNSIQDTPEDQVKSITHDYNLMPAKPTWLFEGRYEGRISAWGVRYQAYQTSFAGASGHTYGATGLYLFGNDWRKLVLSPGIDQMKYLYKIAREIWTDKQFLARMPDQGLIVGDEGATIGDSDISTTNKEGNITLDRVKDVGSNRITAIRDNDGKWAMAYSANGREITIDLSRLYKGTLNAYWFNPRNGKWHTDNAEVDKPKPFMSKLATGKGSHTFDPPGESGSDNDWVLVLK